MSKRVSMKNFNQKLKKMIFLIQIVFIRFLRVTKLNMREKSFISRSDPWDILISDCKVQGKSFGHILKGLLILQKKIENPSRPHHEKFSYKYVKIIILTEIFSFSFQSFFLFAIGNLVIVRSSSLDESDIFSKIPALQVLTYIQATVSVNWQLQKYLNQPFQYMIFG